jgi:hypothetical protein
MRVVYIAGTSHSGSTLLDLMLNAHPEMISLGEVMNLNRLPQSKKPNTFWLSVAQRLRETSGQSLLDLDLLDYGFDDAFSAPNVMLFRAIANVTGKGYIVDSSKSPERLAYLMRFEELHVYPIHLIRKPKGQIASAVRKQGGLLRHIALYELIHQRIRKALAGVPHSVVRYEDLVLEPEQTLGSVLKPLGLTFHPNQLSWAGQAKHIVAGNRMKRAKVSELILDKKWKDSLSFVQKLIIDIGTVGSRSLNRPTGYVPGLDSENFRAPAG